MLSYFAAFAAVVLSVVAYQISCFLEYQAAKDGNGALPVSSTVCTES